ncbi:MAG TPA: methionyl-tRNA formyltransferase [Planctomycetota bacterium]|nr:methionyl-tRNA formyltransferase [Planctomycetota bacterium]
MRVLFIGIYAIGAQALASLIRRGLDVAGVVTKPDESVGQRPLLALAEERRLPLLAPEKLRASSFRRSVRSLNPEVIAVAGFHRKIPAWMLTLPPRGVLNLHLSLLPRYRGPSPWKWAILRGETTTGVTIHQMTSQFDQGAILAQEEWPIDPEDTGESLFHRLCPLGAELLAQVLTQIQAGTNTSRAQDERLASYDPAPTDDDARIRWTRPAREIHNQIRGLHPRPGAWTTWDGTRIRILRSSLGPSSVSEDPPGRILRCDGSLAIATGLGILKVLEWQTDRQDDQSSGSFPPVSSNLLL